MKHQFTNRLRTRDQAFMVPKLHSTAFALGTVYTAFNQLRKIFLLRYYILYFYNPSQKLTICRL